MQDLVDRGTIGQLVDALTAISEALGNIVTNANAMKAALGAAIGVFANIKGRGLLGIDKQTGAFQLFGHNIKSVKSEAKQVWKGLVEAFQNNTVDAFIAGNKELEAYQKTLNGTAGTQEGFAKYLKETRRAAGEASPVLSGLKSTIASIGLSLANIAISMVISKLIGDLMQLADAASKVDSRMNNLAKNLGSEFVESKKSVEEYKDEISKLQLTLQDSNTSQNDAINARERLLAIQDELITKYGSETQAINNITKALGGEVEALDYLTDQKWQETLNAFNNPADEDWAEKIASSWWRKSNGNASTNFDAFKNIMESQSQTFTTQFMSDDLEKFLQTLDDIQVKERNVSDGYAEWIEYDISVVGDNLQDIYDRMLSIQTLTQSFGDDLFTKDLNKQVADIKQALEDGSELYNQFVLRDYIMNDNYFEELLQNATKFANDYTVAFSKGDEAAQETAKKNVEDTLKNVYANLDDSAQSAAIRNYFDKAFASFAAELKKETFEVDFKIEPNVTLAEDKQAVIDAIREFTTIEDVLRFNPDDEKATEEQKNAYAILQNAAEQYGMQVDELISKLNELFNLGISNYSSERNAGLARKYEEANGRTIGGNGSLGEDGKNHLADTADLIDKLDSTDYRRFNLFDVEELQKVEDTFEQIKEEQSDNITEAEAFQQAVRAIAEEVDKVEEAVEDTIKAWSNQSFSENLTTKLASLQSSYEKFYTDIKQLKKEDAAMDLDEIESLRSALIRGAEDEHGNKNPFGISEEEFKKFEDVVSNSASSIEEMQEAYDSLATTLANTYFDQIVEEMGNCDEKTKQLIKDQLELKGLTEESVDKYVEARASLVDAKTFISKNLEDEYAKISEFGLDKYAEEIKNKTVQKAFGNINMNQRAIIKWSNALKETYKQELASWQYDPEIGSIDTVFGMSDSFFTGDKEIEVAFTPILEVGDQAQLLGEQTVRHYIQNIIDAATEDGELNIEKALALDKTGSWAATYDEEGRAVGRAYVHGLIAEIGDNAIDIGSLMHFSGEEGAIQLAEKSIEELSAAVDELANKGLTLETATTQDINNLQALGTISEQTADQLRYYVAYKAAVAGTLIDESVNIQELYLLAEEAQLATDDLLILQKVMATIAQADALDASGAAGSGAAAAALRASVQPMIDKYKQEVQNKMQGMQLDFSPVVNQAKSAGGKAGDEFANAFEERVNKMNAAISAVGTLMGKKISAAQSAKDAAIKALNEEKEAAISALKAEQKEMQERIESEKKEIQARYEAEIKAIEDTIKAKQKEIEAFQAQIDAINKANEARERQLALQKAIYDMYRAENQRTRLVTIMYARGYSNVA